MIDARSKGRLLGAATNHRKKLQRIESARLDAEKQIQSLSKDALFYTGLGLFWGEGTKTENSSLGVSNSDPRVLRLMIRWFKECLGVDADRFMPRIFINENHRDREAVILEYWSKELDLPKTQFRRMIFIPRGKKIYENRDMYYGVLALRIAKGGALRNKILALIGRTDELSKNSMPM